MIGKFRVAKARHYRHQQPTKRQTAHNMIVQINIVRPVASLLFGKNHHAAQRIGVGMALAAMGVCMVHFLHVENEYATLAIDGIGYGLHGIGLTPLVESLAASAA